MDDNDKETVAAIYPSSLQKQEKRASMVMATELAMPQSHEDCNGNNDTGRKEGEKLIEELIVEANCIKSASPRSQVVYSPQKEASESSASALTLASSLGFLASLAASTLASSSAAAKPLQQ